MSTAKGALAADAGIGADARPLARAHARGTLLLGLGVALLGAACYLGWRHLRPTPWMQGFRVVKEYPHDPRAYCQGLVFDDGLLHESTGQRGSSSVRTVKLESGEILRRTDLPPYLFGEGLARVGDRLIQLTWEEGVARVYDRATLRPLNQFEYEGEGWGLTFDGTHLIQSDGSEVLTFRDPTSFKPVRRVRVLMRGAPVKELNELEMVEDELWANVWKRNYLVRIDPATGEVLGIVDLAGLFDHRSIPSNDAVLNGIAYDPEGERLFVTGKLWPKLFEIEVVPK
jgi:glutamine cyclotransferase